MNPRLDKIETTIAEHNRRITDTEGHVQNLHSWRDSIAEATEVNKRMVEVGEAIIEALGWVGKAAKWIVQIGAAIGALYAGIKFGINWSNHG